MPKPIPSANLRAELARADVSQASIAALLDISAGQVSARISGRIPWRLPELQTIARHLDVSVSRLIDEPATTEPAAS